MLFNNVIITSILGVFTVPANKDRYLEIKNRPSYALTFCLDDGKIIYNTNSKRVISKRDTAVILPQGQSYTLLNEEGGCFPIINFLTLKPFTDDLIELKLKHPEMYHKEYEQMRAIWMAGGDKAKVYSLLYGLLSRLGSEGEAHHPVLSRALGYIYENFNDPNLTNTALANQARVSEVYFRRLFKEYYGTTPKQYIMNIRISEAKRLLLEGISSVNTISDACGFRSVYHFCRAFKLATGYTPTEYSRKS